VNIPVKI